MRRPTWNCDAEDPNFENAHDVISRHFIRACIRATREAHDPQQSVLFHTVYGFTTENKGLRGISQNWRDATRGNYCRSRSKERLIRCWPNPPGDAKIPDIYHLARSACRSTPCSHSLDTLPTHHELNILILFIIFITSRLSIIMCLSHVI